MSSFRGAYTQGGLTARPGSSFGMGGATSAGDVQLQMPSDFDVDDEIAKYEELEKELSAGFLTSESIVAHLMASAEEIEQWCEKTPFVSNFCVKTIILPRQARDKQT